MKTESAMMISENVLFKNFHLTKCSGSPEVKYFLLCSFECQKLKTFVICQKFDKVFHQHNFQKIKSENGGFS